MLTIAGGENRLVSLMVVVCTPCCISRGHKEGPESAGDEVGDPC